MVAGGGDHGPTAPSGVEEGAVEQRLSYALVAVFLVYREQGEHPHIFAHERQRDPGYSVSLHGNPGAFWVVLQEVQVAFLAPLYLFRAPVPHLLALLVRVGNGFATRTAGAICVGCSHHAYQNTVSHGGMLTDRAVQKRDASGQL